MYARMGIQYLKLTGDGNPLHESPRKTALHQGLHCLQRQNRSSDKDI